MQARSTRGQNSTVKYLGLQGHQVNLDLKRERVFSGNKLSSAHLLGPQEVPGNAQWRNSGPLRGVEGKGEGGGRAVLEWNPQA